MSDKENKNLSEIGKEFQSRLEEMKREELNRKDKKESSKDELGEKSDKKEVKNDSKIENLEKPNLFKKDNDDILLDDEENENLDEEQDKDDSSEELEDESIDDKKNLRQKEDLVKDKKNLRGSEDSLELKLEREFDGKLRVSNGEDEEEEEKVEEEASDELSEEEERLAELQAKKEQEDAEREFRQEQFREANERSLRYQNANRLGQENYRRNAAFLEQEALDREASEQASSIFTERAKKTEEDEFTKKNLENLGKNNNSDDNVLTRERNIRLKDNTKDLDDKSKEDVTPKFKTKGNVTPEIKELSAQETAKTIANKATSNATSMAQDAGPKMGQESSEQDESKRSQYAKKVALETLDMMQGGKQIELDGIAVQLTKDSPVSNALSQSLHGQTVSGLVGQIANINDRKSAEENAQTAIQTGITQAASSAKKTIATSADKFLENIENQGFKKGGSSTNSLKVGGRNQGLNTRPSTAPQTATRLGSKKAGVLNVRAGNDSVAGISRNIKGRTIFEGSAGRRLSAVGNKLNSGLKLDRTIASQRGIVGAHRITVGNLASAKAGILTKGAMSSAISENAGVIGQFAGQMMKPSDKASEKDNNPANLAKTGKKYLDKLKVNVNSKTSASLKGKTTTIVAKGVTSSSSSASADTLAQTKKATKAGDKVATFGRKDAERTVVNKGNGAMRIVREGQETGVKELNVDSPGVLRKNKEEQLLKGRNLAQKKNIKNEKDATEIYEKTVKKKQGGIRLEKGKIVENPADTAPKDILGKMEARKKSISSKANGKLNGKIANVRAGGKGLTPKGGPLAEQAENARKQAEFIRRFWMKNGTRFAGQTAQTNVVGKVILKKAVATIATTGMSAGAMAGGSAIFGGSKTDPSFEVIAANVYDESDTKSLTQEAVEMLQARAKAYDKKAKGKDLTPTELENAGNRYKPLLEHIYVPKTINGKPVQSRVKYKFVDGDGNNISKDKFLLNEYSDLVMPKDAVNSGGIGGPSGEIGSNATGHPLNVPYTITQGLHGFAAIDLAAPEGSPIFAVSDGTVLEANSQPGYMNVNGNYLRHTLPNGETIYYGHMSQPPLVNVGDQVKKGQHIGYVGQTGLATGPHIHFDIRYPDASVPGGNPWKLLPGVPYGSVGITVDPATSKGETPDTESSGGSSSSSSSSGGGSSSSSSSSSSSNKTAGGETQMDKMLNMLGALETGGQVYGQRDYSNFINAELAAEVTATLGWSSFYGEHGRQWLERFKNENPDLFNQLDEGGQVAPVIGLNWEASRWNANATQRASIVNMLTTDQGKKLQDQMTAERISEHWKYAASKYTDNMRAIAWYTNIAELAGQSTAEWLFETANGDYSLDNLYNITMSRTGYAAIGNAMYERRHALYKQWIEEHFGADEKVDLNNISVTGAGAINSRGSNPNSGSDTRAGLKLLIKEVLAMSAVGSHYGQPHQKEDYLKYCLDVIDHAYEGKDGNGFKVEYIENKHSVIANVQFKILCDLYELEKMETKFHTWDTSDSTYGDKNPQAYMALPEKDFNEIFNVDIKPISLDGDSGSKSGGGGSSGLPYIKWALAIADDDSHGYSQIHRNGDPDYDCSSFIWYALKQAGFDVGSYAFATPSMPSVLQAAGFEMFDINSGTQLEPGDILLRDGHTEIYIGDGKTVGAHADENGGIVGPQGGDQGIAGLGFGEISVIPLDISAWTWGFRPPKDYVSQHSSSSDASGSQGAVEFGPDGLLKEQASELGQKIINKLFAIPGQQNGGQQHIDWGIDDDIDKLSTAEAVWVIHRLEGPGFGQTGDGYAGADTPESHRIFVQNQINNRFGGSVHNLLKKWGTFPYNGY